MNTSSGKNHLVSFIKGGLKNKQKKPKQACYPETFEKDEGKIWAFSFCFFFFFKKAGYFTG